MTYPCDQGTSYTFMEIQVLCVRPGVQHSVGLASESHDNALPELFIVTLKKHGCIIVAMKVCLNELSTLSRPRSHSNFLIERFFIWLLIPRTTTLLKASGGRMI